MSAVNSQIELMAKSTRTPSYLYVRDTSPTSVGNRILPIIGQGKPSSLSRGWGPKFFSGSNKLSHATLKWRPFSVLASWHPPNHHQRYYYYLFWPCHTSQQSPLMHRYLWHLQQPPRVLVALLRGPPAAWLEISVPNYHCRFPYFLGIFTLHTTQYLRILYRTLS